MPGFESAVIRVVAKKSEELAPRLAESLEVKSAAVLGPAAEALLRILGSDAGKLLRYIESPDFAAVVTLLRIHHGARTVAKTQLSEGLRLAGMQSDFVERATDVLHQVVIAMCEEMQYYFGRRSGRIDARDVLAAADMTSQMLGRLASITEFHTFAQRLRGQVVALHNGIRLPHVGVSRSVPYDELYVEPELPVHIGQTGNRTVLLGDPGAGKSTLAAKLAHDFALHKDGRVPFVVVLREFAGSFDEGGHDLPHYMEKQCQAPYNLKPPEDAVEYLLHTGHAVVVLDGLDELVRTELRRKVADLVNGFAHLYPLVPVVVTARKIGYDDAPLSSDLFDKVHLHQFNTRQVETYVHNWFSLDEVSEPAEREHLATSFLQDSEQIPELRSNPLMLALLCAMYSSDRYLPRNLAQVYERCALMLFEQWDSRRAIALPLKFHGRLRGAVQYLAWEMFTAAESGRAQRRSKIVRILTAYLEDKLDDYDEASATALEFLAFCTGRAWVLTDVGSTATEPQFGFTHRTFLEYFAAEHLVRTHRTAATLWTALRPNISQWDVVAQIVLQLHDRNVEGGVDELLTEALGNGGLEFAARSLHYVHPTTRTVRAITQAAVDESALTPVAKRTDPDLIVADIPLLACLFRSLTANRRVVEQKVADRLSEFIQEGELGAAILLDTVDVPPEDEDTRWPAIRLDLTERYHNELTELWKNSSWAGSWFVVRTPGVLPEIVRRSGVPPLYAECRGRSSLAVLALSGENDIHEADLFATMLTGAPQPWFRRNEVRIHPLDEHIDVHGALGTMLALPMLERRGSRSLPHAWRAQDGLPGDVREFLQRWEQGEITLIEPPQPPQRSRRASR